MQVDDEVVLMTTKGEAIAVGVAQMTTGVMATVDHGWVRLRLLLCPCACL